MRVKKELNIMQNAAALWGILSIRGICTIVAHNWDYVRISYTGEMKSMTDWYQLFAS